MVRRACRLGRLREVLNLITVTGLVQVPITAQYRPPFARLYRSVVVSMCKVRGVLAFAYQPANQRKRDSSG